MRALVMSRGEGFASVVAASMSRQSRSLSQGLVLMGLTASFAILSTPCSRCSEVQLDRHPRSRCRATTYQP